VFLTARFAEPWGIVSPPGTELAKLLNLRGPHCAEFHMVAEGKCWVRLPGGWPTVVEPGDIILLPRGDEHILSSSPGVAPVKVGAVMPAPPYDRVIRMTHGGKGKVCRLVCGYLHCEARFEPLLGALPPLLCVRTREGATQVAPAERDAAATTLPDSSGSWLEKTVQYMIGEAFTSSGGDPAMLSRFTELMFLEVLRRYMADMPANGGGWLSAVKDPQIGRALQALHANPARAWTVHDLAHEACVSRSLLAKRFTSLTGRTPMRYLAEWRVHLAQNLLRENEHSVGQVALRVGYDSEAAFNRAFKRYTGQPPAAWRKCLAR
jgi:AraC-like DNA-binding protein